MIAIKYKRPLRSNKIDDFEFKDELLSILEEGEIFKEIKDYPKYVITNHGHVYSKINRTSNHIYDEKHWKLLKLNISNNYYSIPLTNENGVKRFRIHRLVAQHFIPNPNNFPIVDHINNDKLFNWDSNLQWCTLSFNSQKAVNDGLLVNKKGIEDSQSIPIKRICYWKDNDNVTYYPSMKEAARKLDLDIGTISQRVKAGYLPKLNEEYFKISKKEYLENVKK